MDSSFLGLVVDTSSLVTAERRKQSVRQIFSQLRAAHGEVTIAVSAVTILELAHGVDEPSHSIREMSDMPFSMI